MNRTSLNPLCIQTPSEKQPMVKENSQALRGTLKVLLLPAIVSLSEP